MVKEIEPDTIMESYKESRPVEVSAFDEELVKKAISLRPRSLSFVFESAAGDKKTYNSVNDMTNKRTDDGP